MVDHICHEGGAVSICRYIPPPTYLYDLVVSGLYSIGIFAAVFQCIQLHRLEKPTVPVFTAETVHWFVTLVKLFLSSHGVLGFICACRLVLFVWNSQYVPDDVKPAVMGSSFVALMYFPYALSFSLVSTLALTFLALMGLRTAVTDFASSPAAAAVNPLAITNVMQFGLFVAILTVPDELRSTMLSIGVASVGLSALVLVIYCVRMARDHMMNRQHALSKGERLPDELDTLCDEDSALVHVPAISLVLALCGYLVILALQALLLILPLYGILVAYGRISANREQE
jgi:hypothetical protein